MKVIAINGSPRREGNTFNLINLVFKELEDAGIETEIVQLAGKKIRGCLSCYKCFANKDGHCSVDDDLNPIIDKMVEADGIILGSPTYVASVSSEIKALIDRACLVSTANGYLFTHKVGASVVAVRRAGSVSAFDTLNHFLLYNQMIVPGSSYWNMGFGLNPGEVQKDEEGLTIMRNLGRNMAWILQKIKT